jgi:flagellar motor switch/type III secretory pathway protein FliN
MSAAAVATAISPTPEKTRTSSAASERQTGPDPANEIQKNGAQKNGGQKKADAKTTDTNEAEARWRPVLSLPCQLVVELPLPNFKVSDFLKLQKGSLIATAWRITHDVPLRVNGTLIGWGEFEGSGTHLGVRLTELA